MKKTLLSLTAVGFASALSAATITVTSSADAGAGTLRQAIADATSGDEIVLNIADTIHLSNQLTIDKDLTISKLGKGEDVIDGQNTVRVININGVYNVSITDITIYDGKAINGGNITSSGNLTLTNCVIKSGYADIKGGGVYLATGTNVITGCTFESNQIWNNQNLNTYIPYGGGLYNGQNGNTTVENCTFDGNSCRSASWTIGGGIGNEGTIIVNNSTFVNNTLESTNSNYACIGAGIGNLNKDLTMSHCTVYNNNIINGYNRGAGVAGWQAANMNISNSIIYGNTMQGATASDINIGQGAAKTSQGYNVIGAVVSAFTTVSTDIVGQDPLLENYALNGGTTKNYSIGCNSPAYNAGNPSSTGSVAQNGVTRGARIDIGSFSWNGTLPTADVLTTVVNCYGDSTGAAEVSAPGLALTYAWSNGQSGVNLTGVPAGNYKLYVTDASQCSDSVDVVINQNDSMIITAAITDATSGANGAIDVSIAGGVGKYTYLWTPGGTTNQDTTGVAAGTYQVLVADSKGCEKTKSFNVEMVTGTSEIIAGGISTFPNPSAGAFTISANNSGLLTVYTEFGQVVVSEQLNAGANKTIEGLSSGLYIVSLKQENGISVLKQIIQ